MTKPKIESIINIKEFIDILEKNTNYIHIFKFSAEWCSPCKIIAPIIKEEIAKLPTHGDTKVIVEELL